MPDFRMLIIHLLNIAILYVILRYLIYNPVRAFMAGRSERIARQLEEAQSLRLEAEAVTGRAAAILEDARTQGRGIINAGAQKAREDADGILAMADQKARELLALAREDALAEQAAFKRDLQNQVGALAVEMAGQILQREVKTADNSAIIDAFFKDKQLFEGHSGGHGA